jgi:hypothetical protein
MVVGDVLVEAGDVGTAVVGATVVGVDVPLEVPAGDADCAWIVCGVSENVSRAASATVGTIVRDRRGCSVTRKAFRDRFISTDFFVAPPDPDQSQGEPEVDH